MIKKGELYYPTKTFQKKAWINNKKIYTYKNIILENNILLSYEDQMMF